MESPVYLDAEFLLGPEAAHLNITGVSGLATKTSAVEWLLASIFAHFPAARSCSRPRYSMRRQPRRRRGALGSGQTRFSQIASGRMKSGAFVP
jgi:hypothetical protein